MDLWAVQLGPAKRYIVNASTEEEAREKTIDAMVQQDDPATFWVRREDLELTRLPSAPSGKRSEPSLPHDEDT